MAGYIYVIACASSSRVKIGFSENPSQRLMELQIGCPFELSLAAQYVGTRTVERELHRRLSAFRQRGEWFDLPTGTQEQVGSMVGIIAGETSSQPRPIKYRLEAQRSSTGNYTFRLRWSAGKRKGRYYRPVKPLKQVTEAVYKLIRAGDYDAFKRQLFACLDLTADRSSKF